MNLLFLLSRSILTSAPVARATAAGPVDRRMTSFRLEELVDEEEESGASIRRRPQVGRANGADCFVLASGNLLSRDSVSTLSFLGSPEATGAVNSSRSSRSSFVDAKIFEGESLGLLVGPGLSWMTVEGFDLGTLSSLEVTRGLGLNPESKSSYEIGSRTPTRMASASAFRFLLWSTMSLQSASGDFRSAAASKAEVGAAEEVATS